MSAGPWQVLGIAPTRDSREIRRAYAARLKVTHPEDDAEGFQRLRAAYEQVLAAADRAAAASPSPQAGTGERDREAAPQLVAPSRVAPAPASADLEARVSASTNAAPARFEEDPIRSWLEERLRVLAAELQRAGPDVGGARSALAAILESDHLERFDVFEQADAEVATLLVRAIPQSDPLLKAANDRFEWARRQLERSTPPAAQMAVRRLSDLWFLQSFTTGDSDKARAWKKLVGPAQPLRRFLQAYVLSYKRWHELELLDELEAEHPALLGQLRPENVAWWRRFESRPRLSMPWLLLSVPFGAAFGIMITRGELGRFWNLAFVLLGVVGVALFPLLAVEWPIEYVQRRWHGRPPRWLQFGWLGAIVALLALAVPAAALGWPAWVVTALATASAVWAAIAGGKLPRVIIGGEIQIMNSRIARVLFINAIAATWLAFTLSTLPDVIGTPLRFTIVMALIASALGRNVLITGFASQLSTALQTTLCLAACAVAIALGYLFLRFGMADAWQPALLAALIACVIVRRAVPFEMARLRIHPYLLVVGMVLGLRLLSSLKDFVVTDMGIAAAASAEAFISGGLALLLGMLVTATRQLVAMRKQR